MNVRTPVTSITAIAPSVPVARDFMTSFAQVLSELGQPSQIA
jgi:hypothetical protein